MMKNEQSQIYGTIGSKPTDVQWEPQNKHKEEGVKKKWPNNNKNILNLMKIITLQIWEVNKTQVG